MTTRLLPLLLVSIATATPYRLVAAEEVNGRSSSPAVDFASEILPILSNKCFVCHGPDKKENVPLRLDSYAAATQDLGGHRAIDPLAPEKSEILGRIHDPEDPMPPKSAEKQLTAVERDLLDRWVRQGGRYAEHWAFIPPLRPEAPRSIPEAGNEIDAFVLARLEERGLGFAAEADRSTLARRAALVLTGLPPELAALDAFLADGRPDAYERYVDQLLADLRYGEHQARYWLDAVRYGDTHGLHLDNRRGIYPYRDWVVHAFNENLPFDDFITWQLAGDLLPDPNLEELVATGFVRMNPTTSEGGALPEEFQAKNNFDRVETLGTVLLGVTLTCARCHTHKYDPIPQTEYYRLLAFFNSTAESSMDGNAYEYGPVVKAPADQAGWREWSAIEAATDELLARAEVAGGGPAGSSNGHAGTKKDRLAALAESSPAGAGSETAANVEVRARARELLDRLARAEAGYTTSLVARELPKPRETRVLRRGEYNLPVGGPLEPGIVTVMGSFPEGAPRNRLGLAEWLTSRDHPLVARVLINRVWQRVFGDGLVRTPEDFGRQGERPTHPKLLDWLAVELEESGWDLKHMLRLMATSRTFRQSSSWRSDVDDPKNRLFSRGPSWRLDAEVIRDVALWASGALDPTMGGEGVKPYQPPGMWLALAHPASNTKQYVPDSGARLYRRSLYVYWKRTSPHPMMTLFDAPSREASCVRRSRTNTPLQSLGLFNETQRVELARLFAARLLREAPSDSERLALMFRLIASREPTDRERSACSELLAAMRARYRDARDDAVALLTTGEAPRDETFDPVEHAAWAQLAITVLASDLAILIY